MMLQASQVNPHSAMQCCTTDPAEPHLPRGCDRSARPDTLHSAPPCHGCSRRRLNHGAPATPNKRPTHTHLQRILAPAQRCLVCGVPQEASHERQRRHAQLLQAEQHERLRAGGGDPAVRAVLLQQGAQLAHAQGPRQPDARLGLGICLPVNGGALLLGADCKGNRGLCVRAVM